MKKELDEKLVNDYPKIFADRFKSCQETCMCWGFECDDGWFSLINSLCNCIQHYLNQKSEIEQVVATQVKEKYGTLRFYFDGGDDYIQGLVSMTEYLSGCTCEVCGNPGKLTGNRYDLRLRCEKCL